MVYSTNISTKQEYLKSIMVYSIQFVIMQDESMIFPVCNFGRYERKTKGSTVKYVLFWEVYKITVNG